MHAIVSIHDVMPHNLGNVQEMLGKLSHLAPEAVTLLVVPGLDWADSQVDELRMLQSAGYRLAGHGWLHRVRRVRTLFHHFHAGLVSRMAAEHLSLDADEIAHMMEDCFAWFAGNGLQAPDLYVPPAWAMGAMPVQRLGAMPFRFYETTAGLYDSDHDRRVILPLLGFEADTRCRAATLSVWNAANAVMGSARRPVRLSIHPNDHRLLLRDALDSFIGRINPAVPYSSVF